MAGAYPDTAACKQTDGRRGLPPTQRFYIGSSASPPKPPPTRRPSLYVPPRSSRSRGSTPTTARSNQARRGPPRQDTSTYGSVASGLRPSISSSSARCVSNKDGTLLDLV